LFTEFNASERYAACLRKTDGSPVVRLGEGNALALSPDGRWVVTLSAFAPQQLTVMPTGAGNPRKLKAEGVAKYFASVSWFPDSKRIVFVGAPSGRQPRSYSLELAGDQMKPLTPEGIFGKLLSPDGKFLAAGGSDGKFSIYPVDGGEPAPLPGLLEGEIPVQWSADGRSIYLQEKSGWPRRFFRLETATGKRELWKEIMPSERAGINIDGPLNLRFSSDGKSYAYSVQRFLSQLFLVQGLK
jgi:WD40 repeat protein